MVALKIRKVGNSLGATIPQDVAARLNIKEGDSLFLTEAPGGYLITPYDPQFERQMDAARAIMKRRRNVLRELAK
ncbi:AbrB/MazE/SpoVT family DNA-binding domain-containing protein [Pelagibacterium halotolerans]|uniref:AbrB/MazE/SpoVT family DNA-binding domain-containing protein n=1 Tax=Pelagibacterium halotolerans TaxID=531813 RepID=UPI00384DC1DA